jgi:hypothetical protein
MPFPKTLDEMTAAGYTFSNHAECRGCGDSIEWWVSPKGNKIPMNPMNQGTSPAISHFGTCTEADLFRKKDR